MIRDCLPVKNGNLESCCIKTKALDVDLANILQKTRQQTAEREISAPIAWHRNKTMRKDAPVPAPSRKQWSGGASEPNAKRVGEAEMAKDRNHGSWSCQQTNGCKTVCRERFTNLMTHLVNAMLRGNKPGPGEMRMQRKSEDVAKWHSQNDPARPRKAKRIKYTSIDPSSFRIMLCQFPLITMLAETSVTCETLHRYIRHKNTNPDKAMQK